MNANPHDSEGRGVLGDVVALQHGLEIQRHRFRCNVETGSRCHGIVDEVGDEGQVQDVDAVLDHWNATSLYMRHPHQGEREIFGIRWLGTQHESQADGTYQFLQFDKYR